MSLELRPISLADANAFVEENHRHHAGQWGCKFAIACYEDDILHGVAICGRPVSRMLDNGLTLEVTRLCTDGTKNACSFLYGACARIAKDMGYHKIQTYILESENGASLKASGWTCDGSGFGGLKWERGDDQMSLLPKKKPPEELKQRWSKELKERRRNGRPD